MDTSIQHEPPHGDRSPARVWSAAPSEASRRPDDLAALTVDLDAEERAALVDGWPGDPQAPDYYVRLWQPRLAQAIADGHWNQAASFARLIAHQCEAMVGKFGGIR